jgi:AmmeMemoRadiSam system protein A
MEQAAAEIERAAPRTVVVVSPHAPVSRTPGHILMNGGETLKGDFSRFGAAEAGMAFKNDLRLAGRIAAEAAKAGISAGGEPQPLELGAWRGHELDHGAMVPLYFLDRRLKAAKAAAKATVEAPTPASGHVAARAAGHVAAKAATEAPAQAAIPVADHAAGHAEAKTVSLATGHAADQAVAPDVSRPMLIVISIAFASHETLFRFGQCVGRAISEADGDVVFIASGDLSHKLKSDGPYGFDPAGPEFDRHVLACVRDSDVGALLATNGGLLDSAAQCGFYGLAMMYGALLWQDAAMPAAAADRAVAGSGGCVAGDGCAVSGACAVRLASDVRSYEGPFGVGYAVARVTAVAAKPESAEAVAAAAGERAVVKTAAAGRPAAPETAKAPATAPENAVAAATAPENIAVAAGERAESGVPAAGAHDRAESGCAGSGDPYVELAKSALRAWIAERRQLPVPPGLPPEMRDTRAGAFVSIKKRGLLRGCIGTISPACGCVAEEIVQNAISACSRDPRFEPISPGEIPDLTVSVDVLAEPEPIASAAELDAKRYGVIVSKGFRRGLLLPNLEGVDTVEAQLRIAREKAGIFDASGCKLERFEVTRHERGGEMA